MSIKRLCPDQDPDYENIVSSDQKRLKIIEKDNKELTVRKIENILKEQFNKEWQMKEAELDTIDQRLYHARKMLDQVRACIAISYFTANEKGEVPLGKLMSSTNLMMGHPAIKKLMERITNSSLSSTSNNNTSSAASATPAHPLEFSRNLSKAEDGRAAGSSGIAGYKSEFVNASIRRVESCDDNSRCSRFKSKKRIVVGNVSKYIPVDKREEKEQSTHKWMVYVRGPKEEPRIDHFVKKVWFFLHPSYRPNDLVEVNHPPFHLTRRGWGEFSIRVQLHFHDPRNKRVDILHTLKLDSTYTGLQTLGAETIVDVLIYKPGVLGAEVNESPQPSCSSSSDTTAFRERGGIELPVNPLLIKEELCEELSENSTNHNTTTTENNSDVVITQSETLLKIKTEPLDAFESSDNVDSNIAAVSLSSCGESNDETGENSRTGLCNNVPCCVMSSTQSDVNHTHAIELPSTSWGESSSKQVFLSSNANQTLSQSKPAPAAHLNIVIVPSKSDVTTSNTSSLLTKAVSNAINIGSSVASIASSSNVSVPSSLLPTRSTTVPEPAVAAGSSTPKAEDAGKSEQPVNGVNTFIKCADKQGNLYLIPLSMFMKMPPAVQNSIVQGTLTTQMTNSNADGAKPSNEKHAQGSTSNVFRQSGAPSTSVTPPVERHGHPSRLPPKSASSSNPSPHKSFNVSLLSNAKANVLSTPVARSGVATASSSVRPQNAVSLLSGVLKQKKPANVPEAPGKQFGNCLPNIGVPLVVKTPSFSLGKCTGSSLLDTRFNLDSFDSMEVALKYILRCYPLIDSHPDVVHHPYCAASVEMFLAWNIGKKGAAEWQRARAVKNKFLQLCEKCENWKVKGVWSTKQILLWCRYHGYSPMETDGSTSGESESSHNSDGFSTYTEAKDLLERLGKIVESQKNLDCDSVDEEDEVDVVTVDQPLRKQSVKSPPRPINTCAVRLQSSPCGEFVRDAIEQIGVKVSHEVVMDGVSAPLVEEVLFMATKSLAEDIVRKSLSVAFERNTSQRCPIRCPNEITVHDVAKAVTQLPLCDFLTNRFMGTKLENYHLLDYQNIKL